MSGFKKFLLRGNVVDLAVAIVVGVAFTAVIQAFVKGFITPLIGVFGGIPDFSAWSFTVNNSRFLVGDFVNALISFIIIALIVYYLVVVPVNKLQERYLPQEPAPAKTKECPECLSKIPVDARRCAFCTSAVPATA